MTTPATTLELGFSPCPNDTFIFHALIHGIVVAEGLAFRERLLDVEQLNQLALAAALDVTKVSFHLYGHIRRDYRLLSAGAALGRGCGPLLVTRGGAGRKSLATSSVALPGRYTTAALLLRLYAPEVTNITYLPFDRIMSAVASGEVDAGVIIHESRFTFSEYGLVKLADLGEWWEQETGCPIPLGGIVARKALGEGVIQQIETVLRQSIEHAFAHPEAARQYIREHSQEMSEAVCEAHIRLYVNQFSLDLGEEGRGAIATLLERGESAGLLPR